MYLMLGGFLEITTLSMSLILRENEISQIIRTILNKGYRVDKDYSEQVRDMINSHVEDTAKDYSHVKMAFPIYNLFYSYFKSKKNVSDCYEKLKREKLLVKQTEEEKKELKHISNSFYKMDWALNVSYDKSIIVNNNSNKKKEIPKHKSVLIFEKMPDRYDISEVEALSDTYQYGYRLGFVDERPVAVIGVYDTDTQFELIKLPGSDNYYEFETIDRKDAYKYRYDVYQYTYPHDEYAFMKCLDDIKESRKIMSQTYSELSGDTKSLETTNIFQKKLK